MKVVLNKVSGSLDVEGALVVFTAEAADAPSLQLRTEHIKQLLRSKKDDRVAKMTTDESYMIVFENGESREQFIDLIVKSQSPDADEDNEKWVAATVLDSTVDAGIIGKEELDEILRDQSFRGVVQSLGALESLVDRQSLQLLPITEQMESDILRQVPILALIFTRRVTSEETRKSFWESVVRKYFCFARTFLEDDVRQIEAEHIVAPPKDSLAAINAASTSALPRGTVAVAAPPEVDMEEVLQAIEGDAAPHRAQALFFFAGRPFVPLTDMACERVCEPWGESSPASPEAECFTGFSVASDLPSEATDRDALEVLRRYWRGDASERRKVLTGYKGKPRQETLIHTVCFKRARDVLDEMGL
ncbi:hypothetical protein STCU_02456 [Strigomonas culicis]|uniref:Uncharacterized protein n=1 Tax=Strigomonas culicis TaxID=28005 RepID=S9UWP4_9TRYP|nr:hypothetical protein STCU_02456 [Strigomonas culicis]|eukprot:EPY33164.1 hypothetical protein STCU_02456 [Strigomonas culicis]